MDYLNVSGVRELKETPGNRGVFVLRRIGEHEADFYVMSLWDSMETIQGFAGDDVRKARYFDQDREFLLEFEPHVAHYEVCAAPSDL